MNIQPQTNPVTPSNTYASVANVSLLRPIQSENHYNLVISEIEELLDLPNPNENQSDYLEALSIFVEKYEEKHYPINSKHANPIEILKFLMEQHQMTGSDLGRLLGQRQIGSAILRKERGLSKEHIRILAAHFNISSDLLL
jgi:HTH-type transcriptional regulator/antitoxin HigA